MLRLGLAINTVGRNVAARLTGFVTIITQSNQTLVTQSNQAIVIQEEL